MKTSSYDYAVGLAYQVNDRHAPRVILKGEGKLADEVTRLARRYGIPVVERPELAQSLHALALDSQIPKELFHAVAVLLNELDRRFHTPSSL